ncbi:MAG: translation initiation factor IF-2 [Rhodospirillaceae bacterium]|nr:translation initiation factor IF-2 [Rhodospirillaceae bacterium]MBT5566512.1 translation initiation factor IF-2 [Rhodospirillaceae bacterium]MBT6089662.1 translation initiation factor IF-2 [Rhodospirillaceae bacterium]
MANEAKKPLTLGRGKLELKKTVETGQVRQSFSHGRTKVVQVERKRKRQFEMGADGKVQEVKSQAPGTLKKASAEVAADTVQRKLSAEETAHRLKVLQDAKRADEVDRKEEDVRRAVEAERQANAPDEPAEEAVDAGTKAESETEESAAVADAPIEPVIPPDPDKPVERIRRPAAKEAADDSAARKQAKPGNKQPAKKGADQRRRSGKLTISAALEGNDQIERGRSMAALRRAQEKERRKQMQQQKTAMPSEKIVREVTVPENITVQEFSNRMAERSGNVIKTLMKLGIMATINEVIDADTAELVAQEFGHTIKRVSEDDVLTGLSSEQDDSDATETRPAVVTVMGHVDHGKTSLLDALREADVASSEAGGITQHIGAYQVRLPGNKKLTFLDTPGHEAFTAMRARGAQATDVVVLVVAADDGIMPQTIEAIKHAQSAKVPMIVAINKMDKPDASPDKVRQALLSHDVVVEEMGGETLTVEVSATQKLNLDKLLDAIQLQAELLDLKANPDRAAEGVVIEARMEKGKGSVATVLIQRGTLQVGDVFVSGSEWGRVRALVNDQGKQIKSALPSAPVEVLGFNGTPRAGDDFIVVEEEGRAREVADFRARKTRDATAAGSVTTMEQMFAKAQAGESEDLPVVVKADVQGSVEALTSTLEKISTEESQVKVIHGAVGPINESDVTLAVASKAVIIGFNVRANSQAREIAKRDGVDVRYYSVIYNVADDIKGVFSGRLSPKYRENFLGYANIKEVFAVSKVGKVAGCIVTEGTIKKGSKVRLLRDDVVIHEGDLSQLKRFKDDVKDVREGTECGAAFANYQDIQVGDRIECFELEQVAVEL